MMRRLGRLRLPHRCAAAPENESAPPKGGWIGRSFEDGVRVLMVVLICQAITSIFGLQVTMALIGVIAAAFALVLTFGPRKP